MILWTAEAVLAATGGSGAGGWQATGVSIDSRALAPGELFVALRGPRQDGHAFVADAFARGAVAAVVAEDALAAEGPLVRVADTHAALQALGRAARARSRARVAAVTGSVGKTGTKEALRFVLEAQAPTHASAASHNNHWGVPLSLARLPAHVAYAVFELGMNRPGEIRALVRQVQPHVALITWVAAAHIGFFPDERAIARAKAEIFEAEPPPETAILPADNPHFGLLREVAGQAGVGRILCFGTAPHADAAMLAADLNAAGSRVRARILGRELRFRLAVPGAHWVQNSLAVLLTCAALGADLEAAADRLAGFTPPRGRGAHFEIALPDGGAATLIDDSYNANPASMRAAFATLALYTGRRIVVLGDMAELGAHASALHAGLGPDIEAAGIDLVFMCGEQMRHLRDALPSRVRGVWSTSVEELVEPVRRSLRAGDVVLVKGSNASGMGRLVEALRRTPATAGSV